MTVIVICEGLDGGGAVANVAWQQALGISRSGLALRHTHVPDHGEPRRYF